MHCDYDDNDDQQDLWRFYTTKAVKRTIIQKMNEQC